MQERDLSSSSSDLNVYYLYLPYLNL
ncbi:hypothetical protein VCHENC02_3726A, partial [Vibrio harveyi]